MIELTYREWEGMNRLERLLYLRETKQVWHSFVYDDLKPIGVRFEPMAKYLRG